MKPDENPTNESDPIDSTSECISEKVTSKKLTIEQIWERCYKSRDFEISNLWQRSIFLSAFFVLCFSGYGILVFKLIETEQNVILLNNLACALSLLCIVFSILWIKMAKGSKAWYEQYEQAICCIEDNIMPDNKYSMSSHEEFLPKRLDSNLFTTNAGRYSVSRINIFIGIVLMIVWNIAFLIHSLISIAKLDSTRCTNQDFALDLTILILFVLSYAIILITALYNKWVKSTSLS